MIKMSARSDCSKREATVIRTLAVVLALVTGSFFIMILGHNPISVYISMIDGAFGTGYRLLETLRKSVPLIITSIGISLAFRLKFWNIGAEGQIMMGAMGAAFIALNFPQLPAIILLPLMAFTAMISGGIWGLIPAYFKARWKTNETIFTLMMNYIALKFITYLQYGPWKDPAALGFPKIPNFSQNAVLPDIFGLHAGWVIAIILVILSHIFINYTQPGYEIEVVGGSENTGRYAGMNVNKIIILTIFASGSICGLSGMIEASGVNRTLSVEITRGVGYTAIITSWLSYLKAPVIPIVCILFASMIQGGTFIQMAFQIPQSAAQILQGAILFFVLGSEFFIRYKISFVKQNIPEA
ncbi:MAG TPA: ABC transporter permease [Spirochaetota bacterium]|nr:ABC transporter permease [Spirochaetota bacterium]